MEQDSILFPDGGLDSDGGGTNLDLGSYTATRETNLCCRNRPGWFGKRRATSI